MNLRSWLASCYVVQDVLACCVLSTWPSGRRGLMDFLCIVDVRRPPFRLDRSNDHQFHNEIRSVHQKQTKSDCHRLFFSLSLSLSHCSSHSRSLIFFSPRVKTLLLCLSIDLDAIISLPSYQILIHIFLFFSHYTTSSASHYFSFWSFDCKSCFPVIKKNKATKRKSPVLSLCKSASE